MKKLSLVALSLVASLVLVSCGSDSSDTSQESSSSSSTNSHPSTTTDTGNETSTNGDSSTTTDTEKHTNTDSGSSVTIDTGDNTSTDSDSATSTDNPNTGSNTANYSSLSVNSVNDVYGYKIKGEYSATVDTILDTIIAISFNCDGTFETYQEYKNSSNGVSGINKYSGSTVKFGSEEGESGLFWENENDDSKFGWLTFKENKIKDGQAKWYGADSKITAIEKFATCQ